MFLFNKYAMKNTIIFICFITQLIVGCEIHPSDSIEIIPEKDTVKTPVNTAEITLKSTVSITMQDKNRQPFALGSGVIISGGIIVTNLHVISGASFGFVQLTNDEKKHNIDGYLAIDEDNDIVLLSVPTIKTNGLNIQTILPKVGENIFAAGNPQGLSGTFSEGIVSSIRQFGNKELIQITASISPGSSGGPIVNENAELIGIAEGGFAEGQNLNFAIPSKFITELFKNKKEIKALNIPKYQQQQKTGASTQNIQTDLRNEVIIIIIKWKKCTYHSKESNFISEFSILNKLDKPISNIKILFIMYDTENTPVDYSICTFFNEFINDRTILPGFAKTIHASEVEELRYSYATDCYVLIKYSDYEIEMRVLDFKIEE